MRIRIPEHSHLPGRTRFRPDELDLSLARRYIRMAENNCELYKARATVRALMIVQRYEHLHQG